MQIAICDDNKLFRNQILDYIIQYKKLHCLYIDIYEFESGEDLLKSPEQFDLIFLDYQMPGINGMKTARIIRSNNSTCSIVFITNYPDFVFESFEVNPYRFLLKPISKEDIFNLLSTFISEQRLLTPLIVINDSERIVIEANKIIFLEGYGKNCKISTTDNVYISSKTLSNVHDSLPKHCFYRTHRSYVVNLYHIKKFNDKNIMLSDNSQVDLSRNKRSEFKKVYSSFIKNYYLRT